MAHVVKCHTGVIDYERLASCSVRTLILLGGNPGEPVRARLESTCLNRLEETGQTYNALSYTWSFEDRDFPIILNDKPIKVTKQLGELFQRVRDSQVTGTSSSWWRCRVRVDQLCINQDDDEDKAQQIPHMRAIYEKAGCTMAFLGPNVEDGQLAIDLISRLDGLRARPESGWMLSGLSLPEILGPATEDNLRSWHALKRVMGHDYWTRTWILPEATARPEKCFIVCADLTSGIYISYFFWMRALLKQLWIRRPLPEYLLNEIPSSLVGRVENFGDLRSSSFAKQIDLFDLLYITRRTECSRSEDKIFSMLPFAADVGDYLNDKFLKPSYTYGCASTYTDLIKWYILRYQNLNFLGSCTSTEPATMQYPRFDLPSWIPNWTSYSFMQPLPKYQNPQAPIEDRIPVYSAAGPFSHSIDIVEQPTFEYVPQSLFASGLRIAVIHKVSDVVADPDTWEPKAELSWQQEFDADAKYALTAESYCDAFQRTLVGDTTRSRSKDKFSRPGKAQWWHNSTDLSSEECMLLEQRVRAITRERKLFFARSDRVRKENEKTYDDVIREGPAGLGADCESFLMGLGRSDIAVGDEIWALKGGQVLYVLRPCFDFLSLVNIAETPEPGWPNQPSLLWMNGKSHSWNDTLVGRNPGFVGECYVHGLMDGEALTYASLQPEERPELLRDMSSDFEELFIGGRSENSQSGKSVPF